MARSFILAAALAVLMACAASARPSESTMASAEAAPVASFDEGPAVTCDIRVTRTSHGARFMALASADSARAVDYELVITKRDRGGSSDIVQGGFADLTGADQRLGEAEISLERGGDFEAQLIVTDAGETVCEAEQMS